MGRQPRSRIGTPAACYHVLNRGHARETIFHDDADRLYFLDLLARYRDRVQLVIFPYGLVDSDFHLLVQRPDARQLSRLLTGLPAAYWHHYRRYQLVGHLRQQGRSA